MKKTLIVSLCLAMTACSTARQEYTINGQDLNNKNRSTADIVVGVAVTGLLVAALAKAGGNGGNCPTPDSRAADGSRCGNRAASVRPGGI